MARPHPIDDGDTPLDALDMIRRNAAPLHIESGDDDPRTAHRIANSAMALAGAVPVLWLIVTTGRSGPAPSPGDGAAMTDAILMACAILPVILLPFSFALGVASVLMAPRRARSWIALMLPIAIVASAIGLIVSSGDFGR